jgi:copper(I)-binding protein
MLKTHATLAALALCAGAAVAQTTVKDAWVRGTVAQQQYMQITSARGGRLVSIASPLAAVVEIHEMAMSGDVMKMHAVPGIELPAGKAVELKPGAYHVMMMGLKQPLKAGDKVPLTLVIEAKGGKRETLILNAPVKPLGAQ